MKLGQKVGNHDSSETNKTLIIGSSTTLDLSNKQIGNEEVKQLATELKSNTTLTTLNLSMNHEIGDIGACYIANVLKNKTSITYLTLGQNQIGDKGVCALAEALKFKTTVLVTLNLGRNYKLGDVGASALGGALKTNSTLTTLYLNSNQIGNEGAKAIAEGLKDNSTLTYLNLYNNKIGDIGTSAFGLALTKNSTLITLSLGKNSQVGDVGALALAEMLEINTTLTSLNLYKNSIGEEGAKELIAARKVNNKLILLDLRWNKITKKEMLTQIAEILEESRVSEPSYEKRTQEEKEAFRLKNLKLLEAIKNGDKGEIISLIKNGANVNAEDENGVTPLMMALTNDLKEVIQILIENGAYIDTEDKNGLTPLIYAVRNNKEIVKIFIMCPKINLNDFKQDNDFQDEYKETLNKRASIDKQINDFYGECYSANLENIKSLVKKNYDSHNFIKAINSIETLRYIIDENNPTQYKESIMLYLKNEKLLDLNMYNGYALELAVQSNDIHLVQFLMSNEVKMKPYDDGILLCYAAAENNSDMFFFLKESGIVLDPELLEEIKGLKLMGDMQGVINNFDF